jgi:hypothetical protein
MEVARATSSPILSKYFLETPAAGDAIHSKSLVCNTAFFVKSELKFILVNVNNLKNCDD